MILILLLDKNQYWYWYWQYQYIDQYIADQYIDLYLWIAGIYDLLAGEIDFSYTYIIRVFLYEGLSMVLWQIKWSIEVEMSLSSISICLREVDDEIILWIAVMNRFKVCLVENRATADNIRFRDSASSQCMLSAWMYFDNAAYLA